MAGAIGKRGCRVIGVDTNSRVVKAVNAGRAPVYETGLEQTIAANRARIRATSDFKKAILESDVTFVLVPTPSEENGALSLCYASEAFRSIGKALANKNGYHNVVLRSTVLSGSTRYGLLPILEHESGKTAGADFGLCYSPEFVALGSVIRDFLNPDFLLIGEIDERAGQHLAECYQLITKSDPPCVRMSLENAELVKIAVNTFVTMRITFANMLAILCEKLPDGDVDVVTGAMGLDKRIGRKYLTGAVGYGGPCFPRDNAALTYLARTLGVDAELPATTERMNATLVTRVVERVKPWVGQGTRIAVLGLSFKPGSDVIEESQGIKLANLFLNLGATVTVFDPLSTNRACDALGNKVVIAESLQSCVAESKVVIIANPDPAFRALRAEHFRKRGQPVVVVDCWRLLRDHLADRPEVIYIGIGLGEDCKATAARLQTLWQTFESSSSTSTQR